MIAYHARIISDIDIFHSSSLAQEYSRIIYLRESHLTRLPRKKYGIDYGNNQKRLLSLSFDHWPTADETGNSYTLHVDGVVTFHWESESDTYYYISKENFSIELLRYWFVHYLMMFDTILRRRYLVLHTGGIVVDDKSILFSAPSCGGKSTLTEFFIRKGHAMISDDKVAIDRQDDRFFAIQSHPYYRPYRGVEDLGYCASNIPSGPIPLHAIYRLERVDPHSAVAINEVNGIDRFKVLRYSNFLNFTYYKSDDMKSLANLANAIPIYTINIPWAKERLEEVHDAIIAHTKS